MSALDWYVMRSPLTGPGSLFVATAALVVDFPDRDEFEMVSGDPNDVLREIEERRGIVVHVVEGEHLEEIAAERARMAQNFLDWKRGARS